MYKLIKILYFDWLIYIKIFKREPIIRVAVIRYSRVDTKVATLFVVELRSIVLFVERLNVKAILQLRKRNCKPKVVKD